MHVEHLFQISAGDQEEASRLVTSMLDEMGSQAWDYYQEIGVLDVEKDEFYPEGEDKPETNSDYSVAKLEKELTIEVSQEIQEKRMKSLLACVVKQDWWNVERLAKKLDGTKSAVGGNVDLKNTWMNDIHSWEFIEFGLTSVNGPEDKLKKYIVVVDFHF
jgi:hypothetical protein